MSIVDITAQQRLDSRGKPTAQSRLTTTHGTFHSAVEKILDPALTESKLMPKCELKKIDEMTIKLDGTENKSKLGANATLSISMAAARV